MLHKFGDTLAQFFESIDQILHKSSKNNDKLFYLV
jgi:hypothetical protein